MTNLTSRLALVALGSFIACSVSSQPGASGNGASFGRGAGNVSSSTGRRGETSLDGAWFMEFEVEFDSDNPQTNGERVTIRADVTVIGAQVTGRIRRPADGEFNCTVLNESNRCESGRLLIVWPDSNIRESATFEFLVDQIDGRRAKGEASFTNSSTGAIRLYSIEMRKR